MSARSRVGAARRIARTELRRSRRRLVADPAALLTLALLAVGTAGTAAGLVAVTLLPERLLLRALAAADLGQPGPTLRTGVAATWLGLTGAVVSRTASVTGRLDAADAVLLAVPPRRAVLGVVGAEWLRAAAVLGPAIALSAATAATAATGLAGATVALAGSLLVASAVAAGYPLGLLARAVLEAARRRRVGWVRLVLGTTLLGAVVATVLFGQASGGDPLRVTAGLPPGGLADLALAPVAGRPVGDGSRALVAVGWTVAALLGGPATAAWLSERLWLVDPPRAAVLEHPGGLARLPAPPGTPAVRATVRVVWLRTLRAPVTLVYTLYPVGGVLALWLDPAARAAIVASLYVYLPLYAAWASAAGLSLNPLGDEGAGLPVVLGTVSGREFVRGHVLAGALPGAALGLLVAVVGPVVGDLPPVAAPVGAVVAATLSVLAAAVAVAVGTALPGFERVRVTASTRVVVPSFAASVGYFLVLAVLSTPGTLALLAVADLPTLLPETPLAVAAAVAVQVVVAALAVAVGGRAAAVRFDRYTLDRP